MSDLDRIEQMRLRTGDSITMRQDFPRGPWVEYRRTLLWHGEQIAVWASSTRNNNQPEWSEPRETASPIGGYGEWRKEEAS